MRLSAFIRANLDAIVGEWEAYSRTLVPAAAAMPALVPPDHSREILVAIVDDMQTRQTETERSGKSRQTTPKPAESQSVAAAHGAMRYAAGFAPAQLVGEFRALRSSVLARWRLSETRSSKVQAIEEIARFNEAVDQALGESVERYSNAVAESRDMFLAVLGHDLRSPLHTIEMASHVLVEPVLADETRRKIAQRVRRASRMMDRLITDLLLFTGSRLGRGIPIDRSECDLGYVCEEALDAARASYPKLEFEQQLAGDLQIRADVSRLQQMLSNLLNNAVQHGDTGTPIKLTAEGHADGVVLTIANSGNPIPLDDLPLIFEPLVQLRSATSDPSPRSRTSLGLGLYIVREIVLGHHGTIDVQSSAQAGTVFTIRLPREPLQR